MKNTLAFNGQFGGSYSYYRIVVVCFSKKYLNMHHREAP